MVFCLSFGAAFTALGLLALTQSLARQWISVAENALLGVGWTLIGISTLNSPPSPGFPDWTKWAMMVVGVGQMLWAVFQGLTYYWR